MVTKKKGFSLIELMVAVAIVAIVASVAYPSYREFVASSKRSKAKISLLELAQFMERHYTANFSYVGATLPYAEVPTDQSTKYYDVSQSAAATTYSITLTRKGVMAADACGNFSINQAGVTSVSGASRTLDECW
ncbi:type IV pilin protein [Alginatibacterium sediminis]|nr:type IV pilin protein [Alginatibacterium sediminis]